MTKQKTQEETTLEDDLIEAFNTFIYKWCGNYYAHLIDTDDNDGAKMRLLIHQILEREKVTAFIAGQEAKAAEVRWKIKDDLLMRANRTITYNFEDERVDTIEIKVLMEYFDSLSSLSGNR